MTQEFINLVTSIVVLVVLFRAICSLTPSPTLRRWLESLGRNILKQLLRLVRAFVVWMVRGAYQLALRGIETYARRWNDRGGRR